MKWYDYVACFMFADVLTFSLLTGNILWFTIAVFCYRMYEESVRNRING